MMLLLNSQNLVVGLLSVARGDCAASAAVGFRAPERRFPLLLGLLSYSVNFILSRVVLKLSRVDFEIVT